LKQAADKIDDEEILSLPSDWSDPDIITSSDSSDDSDSDREERPSEGEIRRFDNHNSQAERNVRTRTDRVLLDWHTSDK
jgi:hypothetical protein